MDSRRLPTTTRYPYSQRLSNGTNYMRNSVKVVLDAYDGSMHAYVTAPTDPLIQTWSRIFPGILLPMEQMPADIRAHIRYPDDLYRMQTALYATYHMDSPDAFYHREDQWAVPEMEEGSSGAVPFMRHIVMRLPGEEKAEFIYMAPFTPRGKDNLAAWMVARNDGAATASSGRTASRGRAPVFGPTQIREPHQPGHRGLAPGLALGPGRLRGDPRRAARDPDRGVAALRAAALPAGVGGQDPGAEAGRGGVPDAGGDGRIAGWRAEHALRRQRVAADHLGHAGAAGRGTGDHRATRADHSGAPRRGPAPLPTRR
ncbi:MAG: UPF0182 family protein [Gemmatimonadetes bacterium]|nr:UPF0182 family protein [Gemmatimonadota bacterium]